MAFDVPRPCLNGRKFLYMAPSDLCLCHSLTHMYGCLLVPPTHSITRVRAADGLLSRRGCWAQLPLLTGAENRPRNSI